jgi:DNA-binding transcriptional LysR family regulator
VLLRCGINIFDELRQAYRSLENLSDPNSGEVRLGCTDIILHSLASTVIRKFSAKYPGVQVDVKLTNPGEHQLRELRKRRIDLLITRATDQSAAEDLLSEVLFDEPFVFVVGAESEFARRRRVALGDIIGCKWVLQLARRAYRRRLQGRRISAAHGRRQDDLDRADDVVGGERRICRHFSDIRREAESRSGLLEGPSRQIGGPAYFRRDRLCEKPDAQPRRGIVYQLRAGGREGVPPRVKAQDRKLWIHRHQYRTVPIRPVSFRTMICAVNWHSDHTRPSVGVARSVYLSSSSILVFRNG